MIKLYMKLSYKTMELYMPSYMYVYQSVDR